MQHKDRMTREEFANLLYLPRRVYNRTAKRRFSCLDSDYIKKKYHEEKFPVEGNAALVKSIGSIIKTRKQEWEVKDKIALVDIGAAGGALTTLFMLAELDRLGLINKIRLTLVDISRQALESTLRGDFDLPPHLFSDFGYTFRLEQAKALLKNATIAVRSAIDLGDILTADIVLSAFTHHHMNLIDKQLATREMERITKPGGVIGIADERLSYEDYVEWVHAHIKERNGRGEVVPIAVESFIPLAEHKEFLRHVRIAQEAESRYFYYFCGIKEE